MNDQQQREFLDQVVCPLCGVALAIVVLAFGAQLTLALSSL
tara:strand:- start:277 stop:399 length:123 start_codon:yes stop_codon:yes gene_type:complete